MPVKHSAAHTVSAWSELQQAAYVMSLILKQGCALQIPVLQKTGYRVIAPDLRGCGETDRPQEPDTYCMKSLVADVAGRLFTAHSTAVMHASWDARLPTCIMQTCDVQPVCCFFGSRPGQCMS